MATRSSMSIRHAVEAPVKRIDPAGRSYYTVMMPDGRERKTTLGHFNSRQAADKAADKAAGKAAGTATDVSSETGEAGAAGTVAPVVSVTSPVTPPVTSPVGPASKARRIAAALSATHATASAVAVPKEGKDKDVGSKDVGSKDVGSKDAAALLNSARAALGGGAALGGIRVTGPVRKSPCVVRTAIDASGAMSTSIEASEHPGCGGGGGDGCGGGGGGGGGGDDDGSVCGVHRVVPPTVSYTLLVDWPAAEAWRVRNGLTRTPEGGFVVELGI